MASALTGRRRACYPPAVRSAARIAIAVLMLSSVLAPLAHALTSIANRPHACCPQQTPPPDASPCQYAAPLACCSQSGVPSGAVESPTAPVAVGVALPAPAVVAPALVIVRGFAPGSPPILIAPLLRSTVLLL
jgi:hypothetical protein